MEIEKLNDLKNMIKHEAGDGNDSYEHAKKTVDEFKNEFMRLAKEAEVKTFTGCCAMAEKMLEHLTPEMMRMKLEIAETLIGKEAYRKSRLFMCGEMLAVMNETSVYELIRISLPHKIIAIIQIAYLVLKLLHPELLGLNWWMTFMPTFAFLIDQAFERICRIKDVHEKFSEISNKN